MQKGNVSHLILKHNRICAPSYLLRVTQRDLSTGTYKNPEQNYFFLRNLICIPVFLKSFRFVGHYKINNGTVKMNIRPAATEFLC